MKKKRVYVLLACLLVSAFLFIGANTNNQRGVADQAYSIAGAYPTDGNYIFVDGNSPNAQDSWPTYGGRWDRPLNTLTYAITKARNNQSDIIFVAPGHKETLSSTITINVVGGVRIVGLGIGDARPIIEWSGATNTPSRTLSIDLTGTSNTSLENLVLSFPTGVSNLYTGVSVRGTDCLLKNVKFDVSPGVTEPPYHLIALSEATGFKLENCEIIGSVSPALGTGYNILVYRGGGINNVEVSNSFIKGRSANLYGLIDAQSSRVSGFFLHDSTLINANSGGSVYYFNTSGQANEVAIRNVSAHMGGLSGTTSSTYIDARSGPQYDDQF